MFFQRTLLFLSAVSFAFSTGCDSNSGGSGSSVDLETTVDSVSYSIGYQVGMGMQQQGMDDIDLDKLLAGLRAGQDEETEPGIPVQEMQMAIQSYQMEKKQQAMQKQQQEAGEYEKKGQEFLAENAGEEGVQETASGLQYKVLEEGTGESPEATDTVRVHYTGTLLDGTQFDSSHERGEPVEFPLNGVIKGWTEGLQLMKEGATYKFWIPSQLAYGNNPRPGGPIKPGQTLVFEVELLEVK